MASSATGRQRLRAPKACRRCSRRKVKCDATQVGCPCSRCRMDNVSDCTLPTSLRGTYDRQSFRRGTVSTSSPFQPPVGVGGDVESFPRAEASSDSIMITPSIDPHGVDQLQSPDTEPSTVAADSWGQPSLSAMFKDFVGQAGREDLCKAKLVLFGEPSPLTFALQLRPDQNAGLHDASERVINSDSLAVVEENIHPSHLSVHDIELLKAKGAFTYPPTEILDEMITIFLDSFYPIYSIVNPRDLRKAQQERKLPWILLHSICFIAVTFGEPSIAYKAGFTSRSQARQLYYKRAKVLFDHNYENNKLILLKVAILLSFKGPQMDCYWNPCSWIDLGVTMAVALGIHRKTGPSTASGPFKDPCLLKRIWWTLAVRDAHCSALLGRPFRINMFQCDMEMLTVEDFADEHGPLSSCGCRESFEYQVQVAKLSLILRDIVNFRFGPAIEGSTVHLLQCRLATWKGQLPTALQCLPGQLSTHKAAVHLDLLFHYHTMLLHMDQPCQPQAQPMPSQPSPPVSFPGVAADDYY
ncbi:uncharacterized protein BDV14DRAFT_166275 [Aspergillus stella-maris]|uniref:uncharacterized protein n=1 Tax=Aspergillus stella-maris TaxID=1810926 RepID=UPI003CCCD3CE